MANCDTTASADQQVALRNPVSLYFNAAWRRLARSRHAQAGTVLGPHEVLSGPDSTEGGTPESDEVVYPGLGTVFLAWCAIAVLASSRFYFQPTTPRLFDFAMVFAYIACFAPWAVLTPVVFRLEQRYPLGTAAWPRHLGMLGLWSVPVSMLGSAMMLGAAAMAWMIVGRFRGVPTNPLLWFRDAPVAEVCFWCSAGVGYFVRTVYQLRAHERRSARLALQKSQLEAGLNQAQLEVLRAKLNPHFLFNSLQNISVLTGQDPATASRMLTRLGDLLRAVLRRDSSPESTLREELELTEAYVSLEQLRFGDRLRVIFDIAPDVQSAQVPCFILQPLIENAIVHGLRGVRKDGLITVSATAEDGVLALRVSDNGVGLRAARPESMRVGVGLGATRERLALMYPDRHSCVLRELEQGGTEVRITLPLRVEDDPARSVVG
jgi:signal transduction histidine kinase